MKLQKKLRKNISSLELNPKMPIYNLESEQVQQLNMDDFINRQRSENIDKEINIKIKKSLKREISGKIFKVIKSKEKIVNSDLIISSANISHIFNDIIDEDFFPLSKITSSLQKLKTFIPSIRITNDNSFALYFSPRVYNINYEKYLNIILKDLNKKEKDLKKNKEKIENDLKNIENEIYDKKLNIELIQNSDFQRRIKEKMITKYENEFKMNQNKEILNNIKTKKLNKSALINNKKDQSDIKEKISKKAEKKEPRKSLKLSTLKEVDFKFMINNLIVTNQALSKDKIEQFKIDIDNKTKSKNKIREEIKLIGEKLKSLRNLQRKVKNKLYLHYLNIIKEGFDTREEGLCWAISEILKLGKKVMMSYMPKYLDEKCILYLFLKAHINLKIKYLEKKIKGAKEILMQKGILNKNDKIEFANIKAIKDLNIIKEKFINKNIEITNNKIMNIDDEILSPDYKLIRKYKKSLLFNKDIKKQLSRTSSLPSSLFFDKDINESFLKIKNVNKNYELYKSFYKEIEKLKKLKEILKEEEMKRIFKEISTNKYLERYNTDKISVLSALIGEDNISREIFIQNKKEKELSEKMANIGLYKKNYHIKESIV